MTERDVNWGIVKGWLIAKEAPESVMEALESLSEGGEAELALRPLKEMGDWLEDRITMKMAAPDSATPPR